MGKNSDAGHGKNAAHFKKLTEVMTDVSPYNPSNPAISTDSLVAANGLVQSVMGANTQYRVEKETAINTRKPLFDAMRPLTLRAISILRSSNASAERIADAEYFKRKIFGIRATPKKKVNPADNPGEEPNYNSVSQLSFDSRIEHFGNLLAVLEAEPLYKPNVDDLKLPALKAFHASVIASHDAANQAETNLTKAKEARNMVLYAPGTGAIDLAAAVKEEVIGAFTKKSPEFKLVNAIKFRRHK